MGRNSWRTWLSSMCLCPPPRLFCFSRNFFSKKETKTTEKTFVFIMICRHLGRRGAISNIEIGRRKKNASRSTKSRCFFVSALGWRLIRFWPIQRIWFLYNFFFIWPGPLGSSVCKTVAWIKDLYIRKLVSRWREQMMFVPPHFYSNRFN